MSSSKPTSLITFLLDRSYSMLKCKDATIEGFNGYVAKMQSEPDATIDFTFLQFDDISLDKVCVAIPIADFQLLTDTTYQPRGGTPLIEAAIQTINAVAESLKKRTDDPKVVICIQTDGDENASKRDYTWDALQALVAEKQALGWQFNFLGAGINAYNQGAKMGIAEAATMSYDIGDRERTRSAFAASATRATNFVAGRAKTAEYTAHDRLNAGDIYASPRVATLPPVIKRSHAVPARPAPLDLTTPAAPVVPADSGVLVL
jgi:hypothetical protein